MGSLTDTAKSMILTFSPEGLISSISTSAEQITGYSPQELVGKPLTQILGDRSVFEIQQMMSSAKEWGSWEGEIVHRNRSGRSLHGTGSLAVLTHEHGRGISFCLVTVLSEETAPAGMCGAELNQVGAKLRAFTHEINNPLAVIMGFTQLMLLNPNCNGKIRSDLEKLYSEINRVTQVVDKLHNYAVNLQNGQTEVSSKA